MSCDFGSRIHMLRPPVIFQWTPCSVYNLECLPERCHVFLFNNFACELFPLMGYSFNPKASFCSHRFPSNISIWIYHRCAFPNYSIQQLGLNNLSFGFCRRSPWLHTLGTRACADWITIYYMWEFLLVRSGIIFKCIEGFIATQLCVVLSSRRQEFQRKVSECFYLGSYNIIHVTYMFLF